VTRSRGFTLLEVLVAMVILSVAIVTLIQLTSQGLRLLRLSGEHQEAALLADRLARTAILVEGVETGEDGPLTWERRVAPVAGPDELDPPTGPVAKLVALTVTVRWGHSRALEVATLRVMPARRP
jgi:prepilin-type N-terminal cleavage/methylation domain-containing protein